jgi:multisite-specific tRNA:(cytosine-C5)-methyltransferase
MIPPLFLDVQPHHLVLDMCAAPGSKTAQLIEALHSPMTSSPEHYDPCPPGLIMANDSDVKRAYMLVHQATRLPSPNLCVTNVDAGAWPKIQVPWKGQDPSSSVMVKDLKFDRILGDVPCSGDGTLRKNVAIWKEWTTTNGQGLHPLQLRILLKGLGSLRPGGRMVYSTCSLNPLENEAVIAAAIRECGGKDGNIRLVDVSDQIPQLKRAKGLTKWKVCPGKGRHLFDGSANNMQPKQEPKVAKGEKSAAGEAVEEDEDAAFNASEQTTQQDNAAEEQAPEAEPAADSPKYRQTLPAVPWVDSWQRLKELDPSMANRVPKSLWPAGDEAELGLERCMRVYPHYQNTGGFFIAVLEKKGAADVESQSAGIARAVEAMDNGAVGPSYGASGKRALSPADDAESQDDGAAKKAKVDEEQQETEPAASAAETATSSKVDEQQQGTPAETSTAVPTSVERQASKQKQRETDSGYGLPGGTPYKEDPFEFIPVTNEQVISIHKFFGLSSDFPSRNLIVRNAEANPLRTIYLASTAVRGLITGGGPGMGVHRHFNPVKLRLLNAGTKAFARQESNKSGDLECKWRIIGDALPPIRPYLATTSVIPATLTDLAFLLSEYYPVFDRVPAGDFKETLKDRKMGSHVMDVMASEHNGVVLKEGIDLPIWRAGASVNLMLDKADRR